MKVTINIPADAYKKLQQKDKKELTALECIVLNGMIQTDKRGCKYCEHNLYDGVYQGSNICDKDRTHIDPFSEGDCSGFKPKAEVFKD